MTPNLCNLLATMPDKVHFELVPRANTSTTHYVNLTQPLQIGGRYEVVVPFVFEEIAFDYNSDVDLDLNLGDYSNTLNHVVADVKMNVRNTIPFGLDINVIPLDEQGRVIDDITAAPIHIAAGDGSAISMAAEPQHVTLSLRCASGDFSRLAKIQIAAAAQANSTVGAVALKKEQGILCTDIVLCLGFDIDTDLKDIFF